MRINKVYLCMHIAVVLSFRSHDCMHHVLVIIYYGDVMFMQSGHTCMDYTNYAFDFCCSQVMTVQVFYINLRFLKKITIYTFKQAYNTCKIMMTNFNIHDDDDSEL